MTTFTATASNAAATNANALPTTIPVLDPLCRGGILHVPVSLTTTTKGKQDWIASGGCLMRDLSVCCLHQQQRCRAGVGCRQVHVDAAWVADARRQQASVVTCCLSCGDTGSVASVTSGTGPFANALRALGVEAPVVITGVAAAGMPKVVLRQLAATSGASAHLNAAVKANAGKVEVPWSSVCRLHLKDACKYGKDCKNVHVCCKLGASLLGTAASNVNPSLQRVVLAPIATQQPAARDDSFATRAMATPEPTPIIATPVASQQPPAPAVFKTTFRLDEGSLLMKDPDLADLVFNLPTLLSAQSADSRCDLFGLPSPAVGGSHMGAFASPSFGFCNASISPSASPLSRGVRAR